jgi:hypothetical protein
MWCVVWCCVALAQVIPIHTYNLIHVQLFAYDRTQIQDVSITSYVLNLNGVGLREEYTHIRMPERPGSSTSEVVACRMWSDTVCCSVLSCVNVRFVALQSGGMTHVNHLLCGIG